MTSHEMIFVNLHTSIISEMFLFPKPSTSHPLNFQGFDTDPASKIHPPTTTSAPQSLSTDSTESSQGDLRLDGQRCWVHPILPIHTAHVKYRNIREQDTPLCMNPARIHMTYMCVLCTYFTLIEIEMFVWWWLVCVWGVSLICFVSNGISMLGSCPLLAMLGRQGLLSWRWHSLHPKLWAKLLKHIRKGEQQKPRVGHRPTTPTKIDANRWYNSNCNSIAMYFTAHGRFLNNLLR